MSWVRFSQISSKFCNFQFVNVNWQDWFSGRLSVEVTTQLTKAQHQTISVVAFRRDVVRKPLDSRGVGFLSPSKLVR